MVAIEAIKQSNGSYLAYTDNGREYSGYEIVDWAKKIEELGAGEILITSVDREGSGLGFDIELTKKITSSVSIPVIAHGGAGNEEDVSQVIKNGKADAVALASLIHYEYIENNLVGLIGKEEGNTEFLKSGKSFSKIKPNTIKKIKMYLSDQSINVRP